MTNRLALAIHALTTAMMDGSGQLADLWREIREAHEEVVLAEREACAEIAEERMTALHDHLKDLRGSAAAYEVAALIRSRGAGQ